MAEPLRMRCAFGFANPISIGFRSPGSADGGLSTIEEKSVGAYAKSGRSPIVDLIKPGNIPPRHELYLMDVAPDGEVQFGFRNILPPG